MIEAQLLWQRMRDSGSVWEHSGDSRAPHVVLRSGKHSDGFVDALQFLSNVLDLGIMAQTLAQKLKQKLGIKIDWVFGSPMAGIPFATVLASYIGATKVGFNEKVGDNELVCRFNVPSGANFLIIEEMTTTGATPQRGIEAVLKKNPEAIPLNVVGAFLIRCDTHSPELPGRELVSLISLPELGVHYNEWKESECPLCIVGSRPIKDCKQVWKKLLRTM